MKVFILYARENWITDVLYREWVENNGEYYTTDINKADIIWVLSNYIIGNISREILERKYVITTIHHITPWKVNESRKVLYNYVNSVTDVFHSICDKTTEWMRKFGFTKPIRTIPFWNNENLWKDMNVDRGTFGLPDDAYLVGSFQRDTEGAGIPEGIYEPKLEKGPDIFIEVIRLLKERKKNLQVVLTGRCRQYVMNHLDRMGVRYHYFQMCHQELMNQLYNALDLYVVASRVEGGPRAINEAALTRTPLYTTDVGIAPYICHPKSFFDMNTVVTVLSCKTDTEWNYKQAIKYSIANHMKKFNKIVFNQ